MVFQPQFELAGGTQTAVEALARFPRGSSQPPTSWFAEAEAQGLSVDLELGCVRAALDQLQHVPCHVRLAINVSPEAAIRPEFVELIEPVAERVIIELTERAPVSDYDSLAAALDVLRERGAQLAIDDVGAGFASLRHVLRLAPDIIKLDISLTRELETSPACRALTSALVDFGKKIGATIVAEGIESEADLTVCHRLGVGQGQGYYLGVPGPLPVAR
jgi:EAL domain-containing protein (putative c-di-GMP-specific phosphodiesterase class I)